MTGMGENGAGGRWRRGLVLLAAGLAALPGAHAATVAPAGAFTAAGELALGKGALAVRCHTVFEGQIAADGHFTVSAVRFGSGMGCRRIRALGLPWRGRVDSSVQLTVEGMRVEVRSLLSGGRCGPADVVAAWDAARSAAVFQRAALAPECRLEGVLPTTPRLELMP